MDFLGQVSASLKEKSIFRPPSKSELSTLRSIIWSIEQVQGYRSSHVLVLRHYTLKGKIKFFIDGTLVLEYTNLGDVSRAYEFVLDGHACILEICDFPALMDYFLVMNNEIIQPDDKVLSQGGASGELASIRIPSVNLHGSIVFYEIITEAKGQVFKKECRFSDFDKMDNYVRSAFWRSHLRANLPGLPPKTFGLPAAAAAAAADGGGGFHEDRRSQLEQYLRKLVQVPHVDTNPDLLLFLGVPLDLIMQREENTVNSNKVIGSSQQYNNNISKNNNNNEEPTAIPPNPPPSSISMLSSSQHDDSSSSSSRRPTIKKGKTAPFEPAKTMIENSGGISRNNWLLGGAEENALQASESKNSSRKLMTTVGSSPPPQQQQYPLPSSSSEAIRNDEASLFESYDK